MVKSYRQEVVGPKQGATPRRRKPETKPAGHWKSYYQEKVKVKRKDTTVFRWQKGIRVKLEAIGTQTGENSEQIVNRLADQELERISPAVAESTAAV